MDLRHLKTLVTVADADSFASAADQLFITPAAVSQQIRQLESEFDMLLFDRASRPPRLNSNCEELVRRARDLLQQFEQLKSSIHESHVAGRLSIGSVNGIMVSLLPETLSSLTRRHPGIRLRIEEGSSQSLVRRVQRRELDAAIVTDVMELPATLELFPLFSEPLVVIEKSEQDSGSWKETLRKGPFLRLNRQSAMGSLIDRSLKRFRIRVKEIMELDSSDSVVQMALAGLGCGIVPMGRVPTDSARLLTIQPFGEPQVYRKLAMVQRKNTDTPALSHLLYQELQAQLAQRH